LSPNRVCTSIDSIFIEKENDLARPGNFGKKSSVCIGDINKDGSLELIVGNVRGGLDLLEVQAKGIISSISEKIKSQANYQVYPNPVQDFIIVKTDFNFKNGKISVYDLNGKMIKSEPIEAYENKIDMNSLLSGFYIIKIESLNGDSFFEKIIKE
jgi:hypothetical protein